MCWREAGSAGAGWRFCLSQPTQLCGGGWRTFLGDLLLPKYLGAAATPAAGRVVVVGCAEGSCVSRSGPREESCVWWAVGSGPKRVLREEEKCRGGKKLFTRGYGGDTGVNFSGNPEEAEKEKKKKSPSVLGMPPSRHTAKRGCLLLFLCTCNGDLVVTKNESEQCL